jgi:hypothetical protein
VTTEHDRMRLTSVFSMPSEHRAPPDWHPVGTQLSPKPGLGDRTRPAALTKDMLAKITTTNDASGQAVTVSAVALDLTPAEMLAWYAEVKTKRAPQGWTYQVADGHVVGTGPGQCGEPLTVSTTFVEQSLLAPSLAEKMD